ncbi:3-hydroxyacyl-CoA dehydrogenase [Streptococcus halichoeri]|uniref:3-hydroxyacyl-CoA dehydrogenase n=1 Tax=Streptococcus halichoeri TaxID=254785 RepID=UPI00135AFC41|nr:3-hydroxyacyl-CoA dehydrogenase [Streptococcus halichoeri]
MTINHLTVAGSGVLGSQIAFQAAYKGLDVTIYDINEEALEKGKERLQRLATIYRQEIQTAKSSYSDQAHNIHYNKNLLPNLDDIFLAKVDASLDLVAQLPDNIRLVTDLEAAVQDADLVIEAVPERVAIKESFYKDLGKVAPAKTIFASNSSTLLPSQFAQLTGRPEQFIALHFANNIWQNNIVEVMGHAQTSDETYKQVVAFAKAISMVPLQLHKEQAGYVLNSILVPFLENALILYNKEIADPKTIDWAWKLGTGAPMGPLEIIDIVGIETVYNIMKNYADTNDDPKSTHAKLAKMLKEQFIDTGHTGKTVGQGFYTYTDKK